MGAILSRFKKKVSTKEKLQKIQEDINSLEEYREYTEQRRKKLVGSLIAYSIVFYLLAAVVCYFYYLPPTLEERLLYATPFAGFVILIYFVKTLLTSYYRWKVRRNENKLILLKEKKEDILDQVMETETYKVAKDILETFAPEQIKKSSLTLKSPVGTTAVSSHRMPVPQGSEVRRRIISPPSQGFAPRATPTNIRPSGPPDPYARPHLTPRLPQQSVARQIAEHLRGAPNSHVGDPPPPGPPMPRPILPRERGILDRFVEYLVGDGPSNRYALVCRQCESHNGMALKEEFPYIAFRCAYCFYWNPARKQKPAPPRLEDASQRMSAEISRRMLEKEEESSSSSEEEEDEEDTEPPERTQSQKSESAKEAQPSTKSEVTEKVTTALDDAKKNDFSSAAEEATEETNNEPPL